MGYLVKSSLIVVYLCRDRLMMLYKPDYNDKLLDLVNDVSKFKLCDSKQSDRVKVKINKIASNLRTLHHSHFYKIRRKGDYYN